MWEVVWSERRRDGALVYLRPVVAVVGAALVGAVFLPALAAARQESRAAKCAANLQLIGQAYALWAADHGGHLPPRCRSSCQTCSSFGGTISIGQSP